MEQKRHFLVVDDLSSAAINDGFHSGTAGNSRGLAISQSHGGESPAFYESRILETDIPSNELIMSWNANVPTNSRIDLEFRVRENPLSEWSAWLTTGKWKLDETHERPSECRAYGKLHVDHFKSTRLFTEIQYRATFFRDSETSVPLLRKIHFALSGPDDAKPAQTESPGELDLKVPWLSQHHGPTVVDGRMLERGVCGATSVTMTLQYYGIPAEVRDVGKRAYDPVADIYGNWSFLTATAAEYGPDAWIQRFASWKEIEEYISAGTPVIISIAYPRGTFSAEPNKSTAGHLLVVRGFTANGGVIVNDPDTLDEKRGNGYVYKGSELSKAFFGHGGVGIVIRK